MSKGVSPVVASAKLRGRLPVEGLGARGLAAWAFEECPRASAAAAAGVTAKTLSETVFGVASKDRLSPLAVQTGSRFEKRVMANDGELLVVLMRDHRLVGADDDVKVVDLECSAEPAERARAEAATARLMTGRDGHEGPLVLLQAAVTVTVAGVSHTVNPDFVWSAGPGSPWRVGEQKSYLDRDGLTDGWLVSGAARQAAVGVVALRRALPAVPVAAVADLVLARHGPNGASIRTVAIEAEIGSVSAALDSAGRVLVAALEAAGGALDTPEAVGRVPHVFTPECEGRCGLAEVCRAEAARDGVVIAGGPGVAELSRLGVTTDQAEALASGAVTPDDPAAAAVTRALRAGWEAGGGR